MKVFESQAIRTLLPRMNGVRHLCKRSPALHNQRARQRPPKSVRSAQPLVPRAASSVHPIAPSDHALFRRAPSGSG
eukprot:15187394-Alexandrium_andersonii.AAC.1